MSNLVQKTRSCNNNCTIPHDRAGCQVGTNLRKHLLKAIGQTVLGDLSPLSNPEPWRPNAIMVELEVERHPGTLTVLKCGERGLVLSVAEMELKRRTSFLAPGDSIPLEVVYHVEPAAPHHDEPHDAVRIIAATDYSDGEFPWLVPISPGVREFLREIVSDVLEAQTVAS